jgi:uncharacterized Zn-binding protein involved in type VI secretion
MPPAARLGDDMTQAGGKLGPVTTGVAAQVNIGGQPAACKGDAFLCPLAEPGPVPHVGGTIQKGSATVKIGGQPAARVGDLGKCEAGTAPNPIMKGENTVMIGDSGGGGGGGGSGGGGGDGGEGGGAGGASETGQITQDSEGGGTGHTASKNVESGNVTVEKQTTPPKEVKKDEPKKTKTNIESETVATIPADRKRLKIGVGELVNLKLVPPPATAVAWTVTGVTSGSKLSNTTGTTTTLSAPFIKSTVTVTAKITDGETLTIVFDVIEPSGVKMIRPNDKTFHIHNVASCGMKTQPYILPADVSFENIEIKEDEVKAVADGYFIHQNGQNHVGNPDWTTVGKVEEGKGSSVDGWDTVQGGDGAKGAPHSTGTFLWKIPWRYRVTTGPGKVFTTVDQLKTIDKDGTVVMTKAGAKATAKLSDPTSGY